MRGVGLAVLRVVDLSIPAIGLDRCHAKQHRHAECRPAALGGIRIIGVNPRFALPRHDAPIPLAALLDTNAGVAVRHQPFAGRLCGKRNTQSEAQCRCSDKNSSHLYIQETWQARGNFLKTLFKTLLKLAMVSGHYWGEGIVDAQLQSRRMHTGRSPPVNIRNGTRP